MRTARKCILLISNVYIINNFRKNTFPEPFPPRAGQFITSQRAMEFLTAMNTLGKSRLEYFASVVISVHLNLWDSTFTRRPERFLVRIPATKADDELLSFWC